MKLTHIIKKEIGQAMVEFALVLPILLLLIGGIIDFGWIFHKQILANNATREEARYIAIYYYKDNLKDDSDLEFDTTNNISSRVGNLTSTTVSAITAVPDGKYGENITVNFSGELKVLTPILSAIVGDSYTIRSNCTMRVEKN